MLRKEREKESWRECHNGCWMAHVQQVFKKEKKSRSRVRKSQSWVSSARLGQVDALHQCHPLLLQWGCIFTPVWKPPKFQQRETAEEWDWGIREEHTSLLFIGLEKRSPFSLKINAQRPRRTSQNVLWIFPVFSVYPIRSCTTIVPIPILLCVNIRQESTTSHMQVNKYVPMRCYKYTELRTSQNFPLLPDCHNRMMEDQE